MPLRQEALGEAAPQLWTLLGAVGLLLLISCVNVANLMLARASARWREFAVRSALGAGKTRLLRQLLMENQCLALLGGALGLLFAYWGTEFLIYLAPQDIFRLEEAGIDLWVLAFALILSMLTGILFGLVPVLAGATGNLNQRLKGGGRTET